MATVPPKKAKPAHTGCPECGARRADKDPRAIFCSPVCRKASHNRDTAIGGAMVALAKAWRLGRNRKDPTSKAAASYALSQFTTALDRAIAADREAGRMDALQFIEMRYRRDGMTFDVT